MGTIQNVDFDLESFGVSSGPSSLTKIDLSDPCIAR